MTGIASGVRALTAPTRTPQPEPTGAETDAEHASPAAGIPKPLLVGGAIVGAAAVVGAGVLLWRSNHASPIIDVVDGVNILRNPKLPRGRGASYGMPQVGSIFGAQGERVSIQHVDQGALGDCWNVAGMGAIAYRKPQVFEQMVRETADGRHVIVKLPHAEVGVTKELPMRKGGPAFAGRDDEVDPVHWPAYVEKAQAALQRGGYRGLEGGNTYTTYRQLLGTETPQRSSLGSPMDDILAAIDAKRPVTMSTPDDAALSRTQKARMEELGLHGDHYYIGLERDGDDAIRAFNPWGEEHPNGPLSRDDVNLIFQGVDTPEGYIRY